MPDRRTARAHVVGYATVGVGALATRKKLRCELCGKYNDTRSAGRFAGLFSILILRANGSHLW